MEDEFSWGRVWRAFCAVVLPLSGARAVAIQVVGWLALLGYATRSVQDFIPPSASGRVVAGSFVALLVLLATRAVYESMSKFEGAEDEAKRRRNAHRRQVALAALDVTQELQRIKEEARHGFRRGVIVPSLDALRAAIATYEQTVLLLEGFEVIFHRNLIRTMDKALRSDVGLMVILDDLSGSVGQLSAYSRINLQAGLNLGSEEMARIALWRELSTPPPAPPGSTDSG